jgi:hypothetical protein
MEMRVTTRGDFPDFAYLPAAFYHEIFLLPLPIDTLY